MLGELTRKLLGKLWGQLLDKLMGKLMDGGYTYGVDHISELTNLARKNVSK